jgi:hypothetical protein
MDEEMEQVKQEVLRSVSGLPDFASFYVVFYDSSDPWSFSDRWERVRPSAVRKLKAWLADIRAGGATFPMSSLRRVFALPDRPDVIYLLSDGEFDETDVPQSVRSLNARGKRVVVNTIGFGENVDRAELRQIAQEADGQFRLVGRAPAPLREPAAPASSEQRRRP